MVTEAVRIFQILFGKFKVIFLASLTIGTHTHNSFAYYYFRFFSATIFMVSTMKSRDFNVLSGSKD
jgi:hypothetical protein